MESDSQKRRCGSRALGSPFPGARAWWDRGDSGLRVDGRFGLAAKARLSPTLRAVDASEARSSLFVIDEVATVSFLHHSLAQAPGVARLSPRCARNPARALQFEPGRVRALTARHRAKSVVGRVGLTGCAVAGTLLCEVHCPRGKGGEAEAWINRIVVPAASFASRELGRT